MMLLTLPSDVLEVLMKLIILDSFETYDLNYMKFVLCSKETYHMFSKNDMQHIKYMLMIMETYLKAQKAYPNEWKLYLNHPLLPVETLVSFGAYQTNDYYEDGDGFDACYYSGRVNFQVLKQRKHELGYRYEYILGDDLFATKEMTWCNNTNMMIGYIYRGLTNHNLHMKDYGLSSYKEIRDVFAGVKMCILSRRTFEGTIFESDIEKESILLLPSGDRLLDHMSDCIIRFIEKTTEFKVREKIPIRFGDPNTEVGYVRIPEYDDETHPMKNVGSCHFPLNCNGCINCQPFHYDEHEHSVTENRNEKLIAYYF